ncbi:MAG: hypothetical protein H7Z13_21950 [Ferruginibacter sp.]|nr:hypothetical protein [Ferruginibacter sp.]
MSVSVMQCCLVSPLLAQTTGAKGFDAASLGFLPTQTVVNNTKALQAAFDKGGTITVSKPGIYKIAGTTYIGDNTSVIFGVGVVIGKSAEAGRFTHIILNKGALIRTYNHNITVTGMDAPHIAAFRLSIVKFCFLKFFFQAIFRTGVQYYIRYIIVTCS